MTKKLINHKNFNKPTYVQNISTNYKIKPIKSYSLNHKRLDETSKWWDSVKNWQREEKQGKKSNKLSEFGKQVKWKSIKTLVVNS